MLKEKYLNQELVIFCGQKVVVVETSINKGMNCVQYEFKLSNGSVVIINE